jgi:hypothetical protein
LSIGSTNAVADFFQCYQPPATPSLGIPVQVATCVGLTSVIPSTPAPIVLESPISVCGARLRARGTGAYSCRDPFIPKGYFGCGSLDVWAYFYTCPAADQGVCNAFVRYPLKVDGFPVEKGTNPYNCRTGFPTITRLVSDIQPINSEELYFEYAPGSFEVKQGEKFYFGYWGSSSL